jgi:Trypsin-co-occurring domain 1
VSIQLTELRFGDEIVLVSAVQVPGTQPTSAASRVRDHALDALEQAKDAIEAVAKSTVETAGRLKKAAIAPASIEVELGIAFTVQGGVVVAGGAVAASLVVHLTYDLSPKDAVKSALLPVWRMGARDR